jgi:acetamidase/formamidase
MTKTHRLSASSKTCHWGNFSADIAPVLQISPGDTVVIEAISGGPAVVPKTGFYVPQAYSDIHQNLEPPFKGGHILTGPIQVAGAEVGDVLEVRVKDIKLGSDWGWNYIRPLSGALYEDFDEYKLIHIALDQDRMQGRLPWGVELPLNPFFGVMGTAPPENWGMVRSIEPRAFGGNLDCKELGVGARIFFPVFVDGANFSAGDGHALQGDGEVNVTAIETALTGTFEFHLHKDQKISLPYAETDTHYITLGLDPDLDQAAKQALREMIKLATSRSSLSREDVYALLSICGDLRVSQIVNGVKGCHVMLEKQHLHGAKHELSS